MDPDDIAERLQAFIDAEDQTDDLAWQRSLMADVFANIDRLPAEMHDRITEFLWFTDGYEFGKGGDDLRRALESLAQSSNERAAIMALAMLLGEFDDERGVPRLRRAIADIDNPGSTNAADALALAAGRGNVAASAAIRNALGSTAIDEIMYDGLIHRLADIEPNRSGGE